MNHGPVVTRLVAVAALLAAAARADTIYVDVANCPGPGSGTPGNPYCSIQTAIDSAVDTDEVVVAPGTYRETINLLGKAITVYSSDGPDVTTIDALGTGTAVFCGNFAGPDTVLDGFTITGGTGTHAGSNLFLGGGMVIASASPTVSDCTFTENSASYGAGIYTENGDPAVSNCRFRRNWATVLGGGIYNNLGTPQVDDSLFCDNAPDHIAGSPVSGTGNDFLGACPQPCQGDLNGSGAVTIADFLIVLANWGACP